MSVWVIIAGSVVAIAAMMQGLWWWQLRIGKAGIVDVGWTVATGGSVIWFAVTGDGPMWVRVVVGGAFGLWMLRLAGFLWWTRVRGATKDDGRYTKLREQWGPAARRNMWLTFHGQGLLALLLAVFFLPALRGGGDANGVLLGVAGAVFLLALAGSTTVDAQLAAFRKTHDGGICRTGLWNWCRHPNYFFELVIWWSIALASTAGGVWYGALAACVISVLILFVTGIPPKEAQSLRSRGDAYRDYQRETRLLLPLPPRQSSAEELKHVH